MNSKRYKSIKGENFFCVATVLYMILKSEGFSVPLNDIMENFSYIVPTNYKNIHYLKNIKYSSTPKEWGAILNKDSINTFFKQNNLPFSELYLPINMIAEYNFYDIINQALLNYNHIVFGFDYDMLYNEKKGEIGHVSIINQLISSKKVEIVDPGPIDYGYKKVNLYDLYCAIRSWRDGLWIIQKEKL